MYVKRAVTQRKPSSGRVTFTTTLQQTRANERSFLKPLPSHPVINAVTPSGTTRLCAFCIRALRAGEESSSLDAVTQLQFITCATNLSSLNNNCHKELVHQSKPHTSALGNLSSVPYRLQKTQPVLPRLQVTSTSSADAKD